MAEENTILVVDDEKVIRDGCTLILQPEGYRVATAAHGQEALQVLQAEPVNVILCDLKMPVMGALEVLEEVGRQYPDIPVIIITGHGTVDDAVECMKQGAYDFVTKPFRIDHLVLCVKRALEKQRLARQTRQLQEEQARNLYTLAMEQSRMHTIVNCMADGVLVTNRDLEVVLYNPTFLRLLDFPATLPQPAPLLDFLADETFQASVRTLLEWEPGEPEKCITQELCKGSVHLRALSAPFYGPDHQVLGTVTVFHDITGFKELDRMKSDFVNLVSHELRSPLSAIKMQHTVLLDGLTGDLTPKQREVLTRASAKIQGLLELINDLLDVAKIESGHRLMEQIPLELGEVLTELVEFLQPKAAEHRITLRLALPGGLPPIRADRRGLEEVFSNLISNAINYSPDGGEVRVAAALRDDFLEIQVRDNGIGIDPEELPKIFDKFYRVKHPKTRQVIGTGLGLAIVKGIIEAHQGSVDVESEMDVGTTFRVLWPAAPRGRGLAYAGK